jgi:lysophospholipase L1-like esterase
MDLILIGFVLALSVSTIIAARYILKLRNYDPTVWERSIRKFESSDAIHGAIVFAGSSSIRYWKTLQNDMKPLLTINRGFGGSRIPDVTYYVNRIVMPHNPRGVVFYAGENDIAGLPLVPKRTAELVLNSFKDFCAEVFKSAAETRIFFISIKAAKRRIKSWPEMKKANKLIQDYCQSDERLTYIDVVPAMQDENGNTKAELFKWDGIHLNNKGYELWTSIIKPILLDAFSNE